MNRKVATIADFISKFSSTRPRLRTGEVRVAEKRETFPPLEFYLHGMISSNTTTNPTLKVSNYTRRIITNPPELRLTYN